jgi:hypothetical protein
MHHPWRHKVIKLATKHQKEHVIAPLFLSQLSLHVEVCPVDTDEFGTFTGEIPRQDTPFQTCLKKASLAAQASEYGLGIANEGSFGPHPMLPMLASDHEIMVLVDLSHQVVISEQHLSLSTNHQHIVVNPDTCLQKFLTQVKFPEHGLCIQDKNSLFVVDKGIQSHRQLKKSLELGFSHFSQLLITTDMRAMFNPMRMKVIEELTEKLIIKCKSLCPKCDYPGYSVVEQDGHLPCQDCLLETTLYAREKIQCVWCKHSEWRPRSDGMTFADPQYCLYCNP